jgi:hypothetical protein
MAEGKALGKEDLFVNGVFDDAKRGATELLAVIKETQDTIKGSISAQKEFVSTFKAKSYDDVKQLNQAMAETNQLIKQQETLTKAEIQVQQQAEKLNQEKIKTQREEIKNQQLIEKQNKATERSLNALNGEYAKGVKQLAEIKKQLKELEFTGRNSGKLFKSLSQEFDTLNKSVRNAEEKVGEFQRNVGNYASGFNPLRNSINQLTREMPAFANSVQTGFMAISNNIPAFFDAINGIKQANAELRAQGEPTRSVLSQLGSAFFSWGTALSVGVTLLTVYGKEMVNFVIDLMKGKNALEAINEVLATTYEESTKILKKYTDSIYDLLEAQGTLTSVERKNIDTQNEINREKNKRFAEYLKQRSDLAKKLGIELDANGNPVTRQEKTGVLGAGSEAQDFVILAQKRRNKKRLDDAKLFNDSVKVIEGEYQKDILNLDKTAANLRLANQLNDDNKKKKKKKDDYKEQLTEAKKAASEFEKIWKQYQKDIELMNQTILESEITMMQDKRAKELAENQIDYEKKKKQIEQTILDEEKKQKALTALLRDYNQKRIDINDKYNEEDAKSEDKKARAAQKEFDKKWKAYLDDIEKQKKANQELLKEMDKLEKAIEARYAQKNKIANDYLERETELNKKAIDAQERLAERGLENTLAFEKEKAAKLELEKRRQQEKEIRQQKIFAFYQLFSSYAKTDPNTALQKAIVDTALAEVISGAFIDGTENVARDLQGNKVHNGQDGYVVAVDGNERIFNPSQNAKIGNISNDDAAQILHDYQKGVLFNYGNIEQPKGVLINQNIELRETNNLLKQLLSVTNNKPVHQTNIDNLGNIVHAEIRNGIAKVTTHRRRI